MPRSARNTSTVTTAAAPKKATAKKKTTTVSTTGKRKSSRRITTAAASHADNEGGEESEENEEEESIAVVERPRKRTKKELVENCSSNTNNSKQSRNTNSSKKASKKKRDKYEDEIMEEKEEQDESDEYDHGPLTAITPKKYGHIFVSAGEKQKEVKQTKERAYLPLVLVHMMCDFLSEKALFTLAHASRSAYAMVREYGQSVVVGESKRSVTSDPLGDDIEFISSSAGPVNLPSHRRLGQRSIDTYRLYSFTLEIIYSDLRHIITAIHLTGGLEDVAKVAYALPHLRVLVLSGLRARKIKAIVFPPYLRSLSISFELHSNINAHDRFLAQVATAISELEYLNEFRLTNNYALLSSTTEWISLLARAPRLRIFSSFIIDLIKTKELLHEFSPTLISISQRGRSPDDPAIYAALCDGQSIVSALAQRKFQKFDCCRFFKDAFIDSLTPFATTMTSLTPYYWMASKSAWLGTFTQLRVLEINTSANKSLKFYHDTENPPPIWTSSPVEGITLVMSELVDAISKLTQLTRLRLFVHRLENDHLETILRSLTSLQHLGIGSNEITSIACISELPHLILQLDTLMLRLPKLPRDEVIHLYSLRWLSQLDISGSFSEPLYARQLILLRSPPPSQQQQQPYLRRFIPRSPNEAVPIPPIDLEIQAAQRTEFNERVRSGQVCVAEIMNSDQLSLILQQLDCKEFSFAARTCRSWRTAASLKSAWSNGNTGRILILEGDSPECVPSILPNLSLWRYARRVTLYVDHHHQSRRKIDRRPAIVLRQLRQSVAEPLAAIAALTRLESLELQCPRRHYSSPHSDEVIPLMTAFLSQLESRLSYLRIQSYCIPGHFWPALNQKFSRLQTLDLNPAMMMQTVPGPTKWGSMTMLHTVKLNSLFEGSGDVLRRLSLNHQLRCVTLSLLSGRRLNHPLKQFLDEMTDQFPSTHAVDSNFTTKQPAALTQFHIRLEEPLTLVPLDLLFDLQQLTDLRVDATPTIVGNGILSPSTVWNLSQIEKKNTFLQLQRFFYSGPIDPAQLVHLAHMKQLRFFTLVDSWYSYYTRETSARLRSWSRPNEHSVPVGCIKQWMESWLQLEEFHLEGLQVIGSELKELIRVAKYLRQFGLHHVSTTTTTTTTPPSLSVHDFDFLSECKKLESIELKCVLGLTLTPRHTWFDDGTTTTSSVLVQQQQQQQQQQRSNDEDGDIEMMKSDNSVAAAAAATATATTVTSSSISSISSSSSSSLIMTLRSLPHLSHLLWCLHPTDLNESVEFTQSNAKFGRQSVEDRREREWARERYTLKTGLRPHNGSVGTTAASVSISYLSCCENVVKRQSVTTLVLIEAEEKFIVSSSHSIDTEQDNDFIRHRLEMQSMEKKAAQASKKRKAAESVTDE